MTLEIIMESPTYFAWWLVHQWWFQAGVMAAMWRTVSAIQPPRTDARDN